MSALCPRYKRSQGNKGRGATMPISNWSRVERPACPLLLQRTLLLGPPVDMSQTGEMSVCAGLAFCQVAERTGTNSFSLGVFVSGPQADGAGRDC